MKYFEKETISKFFAEGLMTVTHNDFAGHPLGKIKLKRNRKLDLILEVSFPGFAEDRKVLYEAGTVRQPTEGIRFDHGAGFSGIAKGVVFHGTKHVSGRNIVSESTFYYSANSVELDFKREEKTQHIIEWVDNVSHGFIWPDRTRVDGVEEYAETIGSGNAEIRMSSSPDFGGGTSVLHVTVAGIDLYVLHSHSKDRKGRKGKIVYKGCPDQGFRDKIRTCLSFALGLPIVYYGHTEYCGSWMPNFMKSIDALSINGALFSLIDQPPYPLYSKYLNMIEKEILNDVVNSIFKNYDALDFNTLSWNYWYAVCAPMHTSAVYFGGLIERIQRAKGNAPKSSRNKILDEATWKPIQSLIIDHLNKIDVDPSALSIIRGKVSSLNQAPPGLVLNRVLQAMGMSMSDIEEKAWKHRNMAAHGSVSDDPKEMIANSKILKLLFHRLIAGMTYCSDKYIDYYSIKHPVRLISEAIPNQSK